MLFAAQTKQGQGEERTASQIKRALRLLPCMLLKLSLACHLVQSTEIHHGQWGGHAQSNGLHQLTIHIHKSCAQDFVTLYQGANTPIQGLQIELSLYTYFCHKRIGCIPWFKSMEKPETLLHK